MYSLGDYRNKIDLYRFLLVYFFRKGPRLYIGNNIVEASI